MAATSLKQGRKSFWERHPHTDRAIAGLALFIAVLAVTYTLLGWVL